ncbi:hypothetical protein FACS1894170_06020 [Planctomycetales bacterium]|nr:hypothetical protein FACS1894170_06020 [Planctomycetales bacterium]
MRLTIITALFVCSVLLCLNAEAQIPENARFQPGSYAFGPYYQQPYNAPQPLPKPLPQEDAEEADTVEEDEADEADAKTDWEKKFAPVLNANKPQPQQPVVPYNSQPVPYLAFSYDKWNRRFHLVPYEPGYAMAPQEFPGGTAPIHQFVSSLSSESMPKPQVPYLSYYDPDPVVLPATIQLHGTRFFQKDMQPMPLPVPKPANAVPVGQPPKTKIGRAIQDTFGDFKLK